MPARLLDRRPVPLLAGVAAALFVPALLAAPAYAAPPDPVVAAYEVPLGDQSGSETGTTYGSATATGPQIPVSTSATSFFLEFRVTDTDCSFRTSDGTTLASQNWYGPSEDEREGRTLAIPAGSVTDGARYVVECRDGVETSTFFTWNVIGSAARSASEETLTTDESLVTSRDTTRVFFDPELDAPVARGERLRVVGPAGTSTPAGRLDPVTATISGFGAPGVTLTDVTVASNGSSVTVLIPSDLSQAFVGEVYLQIERGSTVDPTASAPGQTTGVRWLGSIDVDVTKAGSQAALSLNSSTVVVGRAKATVRVTCDGGVAPVGAVLIYVDGRVVTRTTVSADMGGTVTVTLPKISRGTHSVVGVFQTSDTCVGAVSAAKTLRVLI